MRLGSRYVPSRSRASNDLRLDHGSVLVRPTAMQVCPVRIRLRALTAPDFEVRDWRKKVLALRDRNQRLKAHVDMHF